MHERDDRDGLVNRPLADDQRLIVRGRAVGVPPRPLEGPAAERRRPRIGRGEAIPGGPRDDVERNAGDLQRARGYGGCRFVDVPPGGHGARTGRLRFGSGRRHEGEDITGPPKVIEQATDLAGTSSVDGVVEHRKAHLTVAAGARIQYLR